MKKNFKQVTLVAVVSVVVTALSFSIVYAATVLSQSWRFSAGTATDYTYTTANVELDSSGAHPINEFTNGGFENDTIGWSVAAVPPVGWVEVPGNSSLYGTGNFLVMKYEAKCADISAPTVGLTSPDSGSNTYNDSYTGGTACTLANNRMVVSVPSGYPIAYLNQSEMEARCASVTLGTTSAHLMSNEEWMTIARNIEAQDANWSLGSVGQGYLYAGHNDNVPAKVEPASATDTGNYRCAYTDSATPTENPSGDCPTNTASATSGTAGNQRRTHLLSNNQTIWDISGNVTEWTSTNLTCAADACTLSEMPFGATPGSEWLEYATGATGWAGDILTTLGTYSWDDLGPSNHTYNSDYGIGKLYSDVNAANPSGTTHSAHRGGSWINGTNAGVFFLVTGNAPVVRYSGVGGRCSSDSVDISQADNSGTGISSGVSNRIEIGDVTDGKLYQSLNLGDTDTYDIWAYVYDRTLGNVGGTVSGSVASLYANGSTVTTTYTDMSSTLGSGWWKLSGTVVGADESREYGLQVETGKTVDVDNFTLIKQPSTAFSIFTKTAFSDDRVISWYSFDANEENSGASVIRYQLCLDDGTTCESQSAWKYFNTSSQTWVTATNQTTHTNTKTELTTTAMGLLSTESGKLSVKAIFTQDSDYPHLLSIDIGPHADYQKPDTVRDGTNKNKLFDIGSKTFTSDKRSFKFYFDVNGTDSDVTQMLVSQDKNFKNANWKTYDGDINLNFKDDGKKYLYLKFKDAQGNETDTYKQIIKIDTTPPALNITTIGTITTDLTKYKTYYYTNPILTFTGTCENDNDIRIYNNGKLIYEKQDIKGTTWQFPYYYFGEGTHTITIEASDDASNKTKLQFTLTIDSTRKTFPTTLQ